MEAAVLGREGGGQGPPPHEPISFGIDQILGGAEPPVSARASGESDYGLYSGGYGPACSLGSYNLNMSMNVSVNVTPAPAAPPAGVIRVPAHRPAPAAPPAAPPPVPGLSGLTFPWMETTRRIAKDRLSGERNGLPTATDGYRRLWWFRRVLSAQRGRRRTGSELVRASRGWWRPIALRLPQRGVLALLLSVGLCRVPV